MGKRKKKIGTSALEELLAVAEAQFDSHGGVDLRPSAYDHLARYSKKHPEALNRQMADALFEGAINNDGKARSFFYIDASGHRHIGSV